MKRLLILALLLWLPTSVAFADTVVVGGGGDSWSTSTDCSTTTTDSSGCWDSDDNILYIGDGAAAVAIGGTGVTTVTDTTDTSTWVILSNDQTGALAPHSDAGLTYNAGTGVLTATGFSGPLTGAVTGNVTGNVTGSAGTVTSTDLAAIEALTCTENQIMKKNGAGAWVCAADADSGGATALDDIGDPDAATTIAMGDNESLTLESAEDTGTVLVIKNTDADLSGATSLLDLTYNDDGSANGYFIRGYDNAYTDLKFSIGADGAISAGAITATSVTVSPSADPTVTFSDSDDAAGTAKIYGNSSGGANDIIMYIGVEDSTGESTNYIEVDGVSETIDLLKPVVSTGAMYPASADGAALGSATAEWSDLFLADGAVINLGADQDVTLTHVADTGVLLNSTRQLQFGDSGTYVNQPADGYLGLTGDTGVRLTASDEDLQIVDAGANNIGITSTTGVTDITFYGAAAQNALNLATTGTILGAVKVQTAGSTEGAGAHAYSPDAALMYGILITIDDSDSVTTVNLPDYQATAATDHVKVGASVCVLNLQAKATIIAPAADDKIRTNNGTLNAAAATVTGPATIGAFSCFILTDTATDVGHWTQMGINGAWPVTP